MAIKPLSPVEAFSPGAELWIIPDRRNSYWARRIDWHLQFLISRSMIHQSPRISRDLEKIVKDNEITFYDDDVPRGAPLLIFSVDLLPNRETVLLPIGSKFSEWVEKASRVWKDLKTPPLRIFLPKDRSPSDFEEVWKSKTDEITIVADISGSA